MELARAGERMRHPEASEREVFLRAASQWLDRDSMIRAHGWIRKPMNSPANALQQLVAVLDKMELPYYVIQRLTMDGPKLDLGYLRKWAESLKIGDVLERLLAEQLKS